MEKSVKKRFHNALSVGYRHFDTGFAYENHKAIAKAVKGFPREEIFLTTKIGLGQVTKDLVLKQVDDVHVEESVATACQRALEELETDYIDLLLIHWPDRSQPLEKILQAMHTQKKKGILKFVGVSIYTEHHLQDAYDAGLTVDYNQVEFHPYLYQKRLLDFARSHSTKLIAYRPFGKGELLKEESLFSEIGKKLWQKSGSSHLTLALAKKHPFYSQSSK